MTPATPDIRPLSEDAVLVSFGNAIDPTLSGTISAWCATIRQSLSAQLVDLVPSYTSITVYYDPLQADFRQILHSLTVIAKNPPSPETTGGGRLVELPVWYHPSVGPDLQHLARACRLTVEQVIERHTATDYQVYALGFSPGFGFMGMVDPGIAQPRLDTPRVRVPAGSVGIANRQTAVYPSQSPGGWRLIGRCPATLFNEKDLSLLSVGDTVRFQPVSHQSFLEMGGDDTPCTADNLP